MDEQNIIFNTQYEEIISELIYEQPVALLPTIVNSIKIHEFD